MISFAVPEWAVPGRLQEQPREVPGGVLGGPWGVPGRSLGSLGVSGRSPEGPWALLGRPRGTREAPVEESWGPGSLGVLGCLRQVPGWSLGDPWGVPGRPGGSLEGPWSEPTVFRRLLKIIEKPKVFVVFPAIKGQG